MAAGKDIKDVGYACLGSKAKMSRIENGKQPVRVADVAALCEFYDADPRTTAALKLMAPGTGQDEWREYDTGVMPGWFGVYAGLEASADRIRCYEPLVVPGIVQSPAYAREVIGVQPGLTPAVVEQRVRFRLERQKRSLENVTIVMGETALRLMIGSPEIMDDQMDYLRSLDADIRVLPFSAGKSPVSGYWALLEFDDPDDPSVVYRESAGVARYLDKPRDWALHDSAWKMVEDRSVPMKEWPG